MSTPHAGTSEALVRAAEVLRDQTVPLRFKRPITHVYHPLVYAWEPHAEYLRKFAVGPKRVVFLGMNPGPFGMAQTGVPFGEVNAVRNWLKIVGAVLKPEHEHPKRRVAGFDCPRCEISGQRLWRLFANRFGEATLFFSDHIVLNYCPLVFMESTGRNRTPDKLPARERTKLFRACDEHLRTAARALEPEWVVGIGEFAFARAREALAGTRLKLTKIAHPSPASPTANRDWSGTVTRQLEGAGVWS